MCRTDLETPFNAISKFFILEKFTCFELLIIRFFSSLIVVDYIAYVLQSTCYFLGLVEFSITKISSIIDKRNQR